MRRASRRKIAPRTKWTMAPPSPTRTAGAPDFRKVRLNGRKDIKINNTTTTKTTTTTTAATTTTAPTPAVAATTATAQ